MGETVVEIVVGVDEFTPETPVVVTHEYTMGGRGTVISLLRRVLDRYCQIDTFTTVNNKDTIVNDTYPGAVCMAHL